jgi:hypothetical protein
MSGMFRPKLSIAVAFVLISCMAAVVHRHNSQAVISADTILLLLPDSANEHDVQVQVWLDAAQEEGLHLRVVRDSEMLDPMFQMNSKGLIVPDQVHRQANDTLVGALHRYVEQGGKLMVVYDACTWDLQNRYSRNSSRLSDLVGVDYALYDRFGTESIASGPVWGTAADMRKLAIPPGAYLAGKTKQKNDSSPIRKVALQSGSNRAEDRQTLVGYLYGELDYSSFRTAGEFTGKTLLQSKTGIVAGETRHGIGDVLFVNLPLGYLKTRTDGMLLHSFLRYFALSVLHVPYLANVPDGVGGLVMNWHIDAASALKPLAILRKAGLLEHGPFSTDFTAGPDVDEFHDGKGLNLEDNSEARGWVQFLLQHGDEVGSHGGWIHNYFGRNLSDANADRFEQYLVLNKKTIETASGKTVTEYSAPLGNQPAWVTRWLEKNGVVAYYFTGDASMGPTRVYRDQGRDGDKIWAFPILHFGDDACLEEMSSEGVPASEVERWLMNAADFSSHLHVVRLLYSHPIGAIRYIDALRDWFHHTQELAQDYEFRWYTMTHVAEFLNSRQEVKWSMRNVGPKLVLSATHPKTLSDQAFMIPDTLYSEPRVKQGAADIRDQDGYWIVAAKDSKVLKLEFEVRQAGNTKPQAGN